MTRIGKRVGAFALSLAMSASLILGNVPALAAMPTGTPTLYTKPELVMDFLGDNKTAGTYYYEPTPGSGTGGGEGSGTITDPKDTDQAKKSTDPNDGTKWNGYVQADAAPSSFVTGTKTIFWIGIGIKDLDQFVLTNGGKGVYNLELGLYYNKIYAEPYIDTAVGTTFADTMRHYNTASPTGTPRNQWDPSVYTIVNAYTGLDATTMTENMLEDPVDAAAKEGHAGRPNDGYGTEEFGHNTGWEMAYLSVEIDAAKLSDARFKGTYSSSDTYYIAMFPFVLRQYDPNQELCIRLARNASAFSMVGGTSNGFGDYDDGAVTFGNWDKYTYHDPQHDLKLMFDYTGDLNIWTNERARDKQTATLHVINVNGSPSNQAQLVINNEPFAPPPSQIAFGNGLYNTGYNVLTGFSGGEELRVSATKASGVNVTVRIIRDDGGPTTTPTVITATTGWTDEWTFIMPTGPNVRVDVEFTTASGPDVEYKATLVVIPASTATESVNKAQLTTPTAATASIGTGTDSIMCKADGTVTIPIRRNSDYDVKVTVTNETTGLAVTHTLTNMSADLTSVNYTFTMPYSDVTVTVEFTLATPHIATLVLEQAGANANNQATISYVDGVGTTRSSELVTGVDPKTGPHPSEPALKANQIQTRDQRTVTVKTATDVSYIVKNVYVFRKDSRIPAVTTSPVPGKPGEYTFIMPNYDVDVVVEFEELKLYKVKLVIENATADEQATLTGLDGRVTAAAPHFVTLDNANAWQGGTNASGSDILEIFSDGTMSVRVFDITTGTGNPLKSARSASVKVYYPVTAYVSGTGTGSTAATANQIAVTGSAGSGFNFNMRALSDEVNEMIVVVVNFENKSGTRLTARIRDHDTSVAPASPPSTAGWATWSALGHNKDISAFEGDQMSVKINVPAGYHISYIGLHDDHGPNPVGFTEVGALLGTPVSVSGIGYNGGAGGTETAVFDMPNCNATLYVEYTPGPPPAEPDFIATARKAATSTGTGTVNITNMRTGSYSTSTALPSATGASVSAKAGDQIHVTYTPSAGSYVAGVNVSCSVPGTLISWTLNPDGTVDVTMPAANTTVEVEFRLTSGATSYQLTVYKDPVATDGNEVRVPIVSSSSTIVVTNNSQSGNVLEGEFLTMNIHAASGWYVDKVEMNDGTTTTTIPTSGNAYNGGAGGNVSAGFTMPAANTDVMVYFKNGVPANKVTLKVDDPMTAGNNAELLVNGTSVGVATMTPTAVDAVSATSGGDTIHVTANCQPGYSIAMPVIITPTGAVTPTWVGVSDFEFIMPEEPVTVTVPFTNAGPTTFYTNLIFRDGDGQSAMGVANAVGTFGSYSDLDTGVYVYSRTAVAGEYIPYAVKIPDGYYISQVTVTPAEFGITPTITGMIGTESGGFHMPAGNNYLNVYLAKGWPDDAQYNVTLHVEAPNNSTRHTHAVLKNTVASQTTGTSGTVVVGASTGDVPATSASNTGTGSVKALDGQKMRVTLFRDTNVIPVVPGHVLKSLRVVDGSNGEVTYQWTTDGGKPAVEFNVPGSSVDVYVEYEKEITPPASHLVTLHMTGGGATPPTVKLEDVTNVASTSVDGGSFLAKPEDEIKLTLNLPDALVKAAYAVATDLSGKQVTVDLAPLTAGDPTLAGYYVSLIVASAYGFNMPYDAKVDVYLEFDTTATPPDPTAGEYMLTLKVNGPVRTNDNKVTVQEIDANTGNPVSSAVMSAEAVGGNAMKVHSKNIIRAEIRAAADCDLYSLIAYTAAGDRVVVSFEYPTVTANPAYTFTMPADTTHIEAEFRERVPNAYQIQVVVNNTVAGGAGANDANLYYPVGAATSGFKFRSGVSAGTLFDLGLQVEAGYQVDSIVAVPEGSGVAANIPIPATYDQRSQIRMPASNLVIYVTFKLDVTTRYRVTAHISYPATVPVPTDPERNEVDITGLASGEVDMALSNSVQVRDGVINEAPDQKVEAKWLCASGYTVSSYTVTEDISGRVVLSEPFDSDGDGVCDGIYIVMPAASVTIDVKFTDENKVLRDPFKATLHMVDPAGAAIPSSTGDTATLTQRSTPANTVTDTGTLNNLHVGDLMDITAAPGSGRYISTIYVIERSPMAGQMITLIKAPTMPTSGPITTADDCYFSMPAGDVDVYVVFTATAPDPSDHIATIKVNEDGSYSSIIDDPNFAWLTGQSSTGTTTTANAVADSAMQSGVFQYTQDVTIHVTVDDAHEIDSVVITPIGLVLTAAMGSSVSSGGSTTTEYTFTMPNTNVGVIVNLKTKDAPKYDLRVHVYNQRPTGTMLATMEGDNKTIVSYPPAGTAETLLITGAVPNGSTSLPEVMKVPAYKTVTVTVEPDPAKSGDPTTAYFVRAAYVVHDNKLIELNAAALPTSPAYSGTRFANSLEGAVNADIGLASDESGKTVNTATFTMQPGYTDLYVVYEQGTVPTTPWYNVVLIGTDTGGPTANSGKNKITANVPADPAPVNPLRTTTAKSDGLADHFITVYPSDTVRIDATQEDAAYRYDDVTGMKVSYQNPTMETGAPVTLTFDDAANYPLGHKQVFTMPSPGDPIGNVGVHVNFVASGITNLKATLHIVGLTDPTATPAIKGWMDTQVVLRGRTGSSYGSDYVDNRSIVWTAGGITEADNVLTSLIANQTITTTINPLHADSRVVQVVITNKLSDGTPIGTVPAFNSGGNVYTYVMGSYDVDVYVILADASDPSRFVATAAPVYLDGLTPSATNAITNVVNVSDTAGVMNRSPYWTEITDNDLVKVEFKAEPGVYVTVVAVETANPLNSVPVAQFGVGNGSAGFAYVQTPDPACNVSIEVRFSKTPPSAENLILRSVDHAGLAGNVARLDVGKTNTYDITLIPTSGSLSPFDQTKTGVTPGTALGVEADWASGYEVKRVDVITGGMTVPFTLYKSSGATPVYTLKDPAGTVVNLTMPLTATTIEVIFAPESGVLRPYDPENTPDTAQYKDHWIKAENRGDYLIVTVDMLNKKDGSSPTDVVFDYQVKENRFRFYLWDGVSMTGSDPTYVDVMDVIKLERPEDAPTATSTDPTEYWLMPDAYTYVVNGNKYDSAKFKLSVKEDSALTAAQQGKARILRQILDNDGTKHSSDVYSLYIVNEQKEYTGGVLSTTKESEKVDFEVPRYYSLVGKLESFAPTHIAEFTLKSAGVNDPVYVSTLADETGMDLCRQDFKVKLTSDLSKLTGKVFTLTIEKASHITYTRTTIDLNVTTATAAGRYDAGKLEFSFEYPIQLICGDLDGNGAVKERDINLFLAVMNGPYTWNTQTSKTAADWGDSVYNPASMGYLADLNGDGRINDRDLNILYDEPSYNLDKTYYGTPTGLGGYMMTLYSMRLYPDWVKDMIREGRFDKIPDWTIKRILTGWTAPEWCAELVKSETAIPDWAVTMALNGTELPVWASFCLKMDVAMPRWTEELLMNGKAIPEWCAGKVMMGRGDEIPDWYVSMLAEDKNVPEWAVTCLTNDVVIPEWAVEKLTAREELPGWAAACLTNDVAIPEWAMEQLMNDVELPEWCAELAAAGEALPEWAEELIANGEALPEEPIAPEAEKPVAPELEKPVAVEKPEGATVGADSVRPEGEEKPEGAENAEKPEGIEKPEGAENAEKPDDAENAEKPEGAENAEKPDDATVGAGPRPARDPEDTPDVTTNEDESEGEGVGCDDPAHRDPEDTPDVTTNEDATVGAGPRPARDPEDTPDVTTSDDATVGADSVRPEGEEEPNEGEEEDEDRCVKDAAPYEEGPEEAGETPETVEPEVITSVDDTCSQDGETE